MLSVMTMTKTTTILMMTLKMAIILGIHGVDDVEADDSNDADDETDDDDEDYD